MFLSIGKKNIEYCIDENGCWIPNINPTGLSIDKYGYPKIFYDGNSRSIYRVYYKLTIKNIDGSIILRHTCDNRMCINPNHLLEGSHKDNVADRVSRNRSAIGEENGRSKLKEYQIYEIRNSNLNNTQLSKIYHVDRCLIREIKNYKLWKHLP